MTRREQARLQMVAAATAIALEVCNGRITFAMGETDRDAERALACCAQFGLADPERMKAALELGINLVAGADRYLVHDEPERKEALARARAEGRA